MENIIKEIERPSENSPEILMNTDKSHSDVIETEESSIDIANTPEDSENSENSDIPADSVDSDNSEDSSAPLTLGNIRRLLADKNPSSPMLRHLDNSLTRIEGFRQGRGMSLEDIESDVNSLLSISADVARGVISTDAIDLISRARNYDNDIKRAFAEGEITGRNATIEEKLTDNKLKSDGVPALGGSSASSSKSRPATIFDLAGFAR